MSLIKNFILQAKGIVVQLLFLMLSMNPGFSQIQLLPDEDCYIFAGGLKADNIYGALDKDTLITRKSIASNEFTRETYLLFNLGSPDTTYSSALLKLYGKVLESKKVQIYSTDTAWSEEALTGNTRPAGVFIGEEVLEAGEGYYSWDVSRYVNLSLKSGKQRIAFILKDVAGSVSTKDTKWHSKENASGNGPFLELTIGPVAVHRKGSYYIDSVLGDDSNSAVSPDEAWKSLGKLSDMVFEPGDSILFKSGCTWEGLLSFGGSGMVGQPIVVTKYGTGAKPIIAGMGRVENTVQLTNQQYIELQNLHLTNMGSSVAFRRALYILAEDQGAVRHIVLRDLEISDVNGSMEGEISKNNGGIFLEIAGSHKPTWFDSLVIEGCYIHDVDRTGCSNKSSWSGRTLTTNTNWVPSENILIRNNVFERTGANGLIVRVANKPIMEYNLFTHCAIKGSGNASFNFNTDSAVWQYNEACFTKYNEGDADAGGFDSDYNTKHTIIQYNYSHDNEFGALLITGGPLSSNGFNEGTIIRYNVMKDNHDHVIRASGMATNLSVYNNTVISGSQIANPVLIWHKSWEGYVANTRYYNNIFHTLGTGATVDLGASTGNIFDYNTFSGASVTGLPTDPHKHSADPLFAGAADITTRFDSCLIYRLSKDSPEINSGKSITGTAGFDLVGNPVPFYSLPDRGAFEYTGPLSDINAFSPSRLVVFPNPAGSILMATLKGVPPGRTRADIYSIDGKHIWHKEFFPDNSEMGFHISPIEIGCSTGMYILRVTCNDDTFRQTNFTIQ